MLRDNRLANNMSMTSVVRIVSNLLRDQFVRFLIVGSGATLLQYILLIGLAELGQLPLTVCSALSYAVSAIFNYLANYYFTFDSKRNHVHAISRFAVTVCLGLVINTLVFYLSNKIVAYYLIAQAVATIVTLLSNFLCNRYWVYR